MNSSESGLVHLFKAQAAATPDEVAIVFPGEEMSYSQLDQATDALGAYLHHCGVSTDDPVGIFMDTCPEYIVASIGALKAGAAFMPMSVDSPEPLLRSVVSQSQPKVVITKASYVPRLSELSATHVLPMDSDQSWKRSGAATPKVDPACDSLAFIPYTSGTTGDPKGVMLAGSSVASSYFARYRFSSYSVGDRVACNIFFPWEFLRPLLKGGTVYVIPDDVVFLPRALTEFISEHRISEILFTPSLLQGILNSADHQLLRARLSSLRVVWLNGEVVPTSLLRLALDVLPDTARVFNTYSISETHDVCTVDLTDLRLDGVDVCPVGLPMDGVAVRVIPEGGSTLASQGAGELFIGGRGLARGYLKRPDLDAGKFVSLNGDRYYATGDLAEIDSQGMTTIIGRNDSMVKIRGYTVYLGAIEEALRKHCNVADVAVLAEPVDETTKRLVAYVVPAPQATWKVDSRSGTSKDLRSILERYLPLYMVPSHFVRLGALPINQQTGKLERKALPATRTTRPSAEERAPLPRNATDAERLRALRDIWGRALDVDGDSLEDDWNFFDVGGHSLAGLEITLGIERAFGVQLGGAEVYEYPTIGELAAYLQDRGTSRESRVTLAEDSVLDPEISPKGNVRTTRLSEASSVLVTGATGFLGAFLLDELLRSTGRDTLFYCIVRDRSSAATAPTNRVLESLRFFGLPGQSEENRIVPLTGDITQPRMGLEEYAYRELADKIDLIFHCAASVNYAYPYSAARPHTVGGTLEVLKFACASVTKPVVYISSNGIFPGGDESPYLENNLIDGFVDRMEGGYNQAKWVAERLVWSAVSRGLPVCIFRPGNIGHHSATGAVNPNDFLSLIIKACARLGCAPYAPEWYFEMTSVDFLTTAIARIVDDTRHLGRVYNVVQQKPVPADSVFAYMESHGYLTDRAPIGEWKSRLEEMADREEDMELKVLVRSLESVEPYLADTSVYDISQFAKTISEIGLTMPKVDVDYVTSFLRR
ncbi:MAG: thioester reductase domain-containing protein [Chloroflexota bacterium]|nr:thioester reductase domain-containing protein [Chloroflexota bacterium]MDE2941432.1 thioester reductase domain-containing protein [Chloroflexota bacterium]MDE3267650.1 thioester reductase domain-containing protein [Chloroflexota bacterium]